MSITRQLRPHVDDAFAAAAAAAAAGDIEAAWRHLERAHILSQPSAWLHTRAHARMLVLGLRVGDTTEVVGQVIRLAGGWLGSLVGRFPGGNTGRARVSITAPMPVPDDLQRVFDGLGIDPGSARVFK